MKNSSSLLLIAAFISMPAISSDQLGKPYINLGIGYGELNPENTQGAIILREKGSTNFSAGIGLKLNEFISFEANYLNTGNNKTKFIANNMLLESSSKGQGGGFGIVGKLPVTDKMGIRI